MKRRRVIFVAVACVVAVISIAIVWPREREPEYGGKSLTQWAAVYWKQRFVGVDPLLAIRPAPWQYVPLSREAEEAREAIRKMGTNTLPWMLKWIRYERPAWKFRWAARMGKLPRGLRQSSVANQIQAKLLFDDGIVHVRTAAACFEALGSEAKPAVRELASQLKTFSSIQISEQAAAALAFIGEEGLGPLVAFVTNERIHPSFRYRACEHIGSMGSGAAPALPTLVRCMEGTDSTVAKGAVKALTMLGEAARPAVPLLVRIVQDPKSPKRGEAKAVLHKIAPEVLPKEN